MKHLYIRLLFATAMIILGLSSCNERNYRMITKINKNASVSREIYAHGDSSFLAGDSTHNPFLFNFESDWHLEKLNTTAENTFRSKKENVKISKTFQNIEETSSNVSFDPIFRSFVRPEESVKKQFRWFYTTYTYTGIYKKLDLTKIPVPIDKYMNKEEQKLWFQGVTDNLQGMNGIELKDNLDNLENQFFTWISRNVYETSFSTIQHFIEISPDSPYTLSQLTGIKDSLFVTNSVDIENTDFQTSDVCKMLDKYYKTNYFTDLYNGKKNIINEFYDKNYGWGNELFTTSIEFELIIPGEIMNANAGMVRQDTLTWKVDGMRLIADDYQLVAQSRITNTWAFIVTFILILITLGCILKMLTIKRKYRLK